MLQKRSLPKLAYRDVFAYDDCKFTAGIAKGLGIANAF